MKDHVGINDTRQLLDAIRWIRKNYLMVFLVRLPG